jgi:hypothetical protein
MKHVAGWLWSTIVLCGLIAAAPCAAGEGLHGKARGPGPTVPAPLADSGSGGAAPIAPADCESAAGSGADVVAGQEPRSGVVGDPAEAPRGPGRPQGWRSLLPGALR